MSKYDPLKYHLERSGRTKVAMSFDEVADLVGGLPNSAYRHQAWWANEREGRHVQARSWTKAGYIVGEVDIRSRRVTFRRS